jgi:hypothetical protein
MSVQVNEEKMENIEGGTLPAEAAEATEQTEAAAGVEVVETEEPPARRAGLFEFLNSRTVLLVVGAILIGVVFWHLQFSTGSLCCGDYDAYYHFRWSRMLWEGMRTGHFPPTFDALPLTTLNPKDYVDHHFLFHLLQIPFTFIFSDFQTGAKFGTWLFACLAVFSCYWLLVRNRVSYPLVWLVAIIGSSAPFLYRMNMGKAMSVSIVLLIIGIHLLFERKHRWLLLLAFVFALTYDMFFLLIALAGMWTFVVLWSERRIEWKPLPFVLLGSLLGFIINPYFPHNFQLLYEHLVIKVTASDFTTTVGSEWYPYSTWEFLGNCGVALAAMLAGYVSFKDSASEGRQRAFLLMLFSTLLMLANMRWRRFAEYFPPFAILFAAFAAEPLIRRARDLYTSREPAVERPETEGEPRIAEPARVENARAWEMILVSTAFVLLTAPMVWYVRVTAQDIKGMAGPDLYKGGMEWLSKNAEPGELIVNTDWDDFPKLFFYNPRLAWVSGLDPTYLLDKDRRLAELHGKITIAKDLSDEEVANLGPLIRDNFCLGEGDKKRCARYVFTDHEHEAFLNDALDSGWFDEVYVDGDCSILRRREQKGEPPLDTPPPGESANEPEEDEPQEN